MKRMLTLLLIGAFVFGHGVLPGQNVALNFDGSGDYITVSPIAGWSPNTDFTFEAWFTASPDGLGCSGNFRRLFSLFNPDRFEVGQCGGELYLFWTDPSFNSHFNIQTPGINILDGAWHCIGVVRSGPVVDIYLDGGVVYSVSTVGTINFSLFRVGHWVGGATPNQDWLGEIDEVRLWNTALPASHLMVCSNCPPPPIPAQTPVVYWPLDDGIPGQPNTSITTVADASSFGNTGVLNPPGNAGHDLTDPGGNFIPGVPIVLPAYHDLSVFISDPIQMVGIGAVCNGASVHFSLIDPNFNTPQPGAGVTVDWQFSDDQGQSWTPIPSLNGFQFGVPANVATAISCPGTTGYVDREFRAIITVTNANGACVYTSQPALLRIYCEITQVNVQVAPPGPFCEGDQVSFTVSVTTNLPAPDPTNDVHIDWCISTDGGLNWTTLSQYYDQTNFIYPTITVGMQNICFKALVSNVTCGTKTGPTCVKVDPKPVCGSIIGWPTPANLTLLGSTPWLTYEICPDNDATVGMDPSMPPFQHCNPQWQYSFGDPNNPTNPSAWNWIDLGFSNSLQNTNILPTSLWGANTSIYYRIECQPLSTPSGCLPCYSNIVEIKLKPQPPVPTVFAVPNTQTICYGDVLTLYASNDPGTTTTWYCNGEIAGTGPILPVSNQACYWTEVTDGCYTLKSDTFCLKVCVAVAKITCPITNPCIIPNIPITLSGLDSYSVNCGPIVSYHWEVEYLPSGAIYFFNTPTITFTPPAGGAIVTLTVIDSNGCTHSVQSFFKPCQP